METVFGPGPPPDLASDCPGLPLDWEVELVSDCPGLPPVLVSVAELVSDCPGLPPATASTGLLLPSRFIPELELVPDEERNCC